MFCWRCVTTYFTPANSVSVLFIRDVNNKTDSDITIYEQSCSYAYFINNELYYQRTNCYKK